MYLKKCKNKYKNASDLIKVLSEPRSNMHASEINYQSRPRAFMIKNKGYL